MAKKTTSPIGRKEFLAKAKPLTILLNGIPLLAEVKDFSTGSLGWYLNVKSVVEIDGQAIPVQINASLIVVGSKELPRDEETPAKEETDEQGS